MSMMLRKGMLPRKQRTASMKPSRQVSAPAAKKKPEMVVAPNGQKIRKSNFEKSYADLGGYRKPPLVVSKKAVASGGKKAYVDAAKGQQFGRGTKHKMIKSAQKYDASSAGGSWPAVPEVMGPKQAQTRGLLGAMERGWHGISAWGWHKKNAQLGQPAVQPKPLKY